MFGFRTSTHLMCDNPSLTQLEEWSAVEHYFVKLICPLKSIIYIPHSFVRISTETIMNLCGLHLPYSRSVIILATIFAINNTINQAEARFKRCFTCRSRGPMGDCRDPFDFNSTTFDGQKNMKPAIEATPCASGWCAKIIEDDLGDSIAATERSCMTRPPTDNEERCSQTLLENNRDRKVFLCMCYGDLCNAATSINDSFISNLMAAALIILGIFSSSRYIL